MNNFRVGFFQTYNYYNFSERVDYNINDNWRVYRAHRTLPYRRPSGRSDPKQLAVVRADRNAQRGHANLGRRGVDGDTRPPSSISTATGTRSSTRTYRRALPEGGWANIWPGNPWYESFQKASPGVPLYFPNLDIGGSAFGGGGFYWNQMPKGESINAKVSQQRGSHYLKAGLEYRRSYGLSFVSNTSRFNFPATLTANTPVNPNTLDTGSGVAAFLLGAMNPDATQMIGGPAPDPHIKYYGMFIQDDWKISRNITLNLGLRNEYETGLLRSAALLRQGSRCDRSRSGDAGQSAANAGTGARIGRGQLFQMERPVSVDRRFQSERNVGFAEVYSSASRRHRDQDHRQTAFRAGFARYVTPMELGVITPPISGFETVGFLSPPYFGVTGFPESCSADPGCSAGELRRSISRQQQPAASDRRQSRRHERRPRSNSGNVLVSDESQEAVEQSAQLQLPAPVSEPVRRLR